MLYARKKLFPLNYNIFLFSVNSKYYYFHCSLVSNVVWGSFLFFYIYKKNDVNSIQYDIFGWLLSYSILYKMSRIAQHELIIVCTKTPSIECLILNLCVLYARLIGHKWKHETVKKKAIINIRF